jgi:hypothetical protein
MQMLAVSFMSCTMELIADEARNRLICEDVVQSVQEGRSPVVLTERTETGAACGAVVSHVRHFIILRGGMGRKELNAVIARLASIPRMKKGFAGDRTVPWRRVRRCQAGSLF